MEILGHGIDIVAIERVAAAIDAHGDRFVERVFTGEERAYAEAGRNVRFERYAGRFACKEAVLKALGTGWTGGIAWTDVSVRREPDGRPVVALGGRAAEIAAARGIRGWQVSISHAAGLATASVIAIG